MLTSPVISGNMTLPGLPMKHERAIIRRAAWTALITCAAIAALAARCAYAKNNHIPSSVTYYADARGVFTLERPSASTGYSVDLTGTCRLPELMFKIQKKNTASRFRQYAYRTGSKTDYKMTCLLKDGPGEYDITVFGRTTLTARRLNGLCSVTVAATKSLPEKLISLSINDRILSFVDSVMGKTVGSGECWDLAQEALDLNGADWDRPINFGRLLNPARDEILPGDIMQLKSVRLIATLPGGMTMYQTLGAPDHTAIIIKVEGRNRYRIAHQNSENRRYVVTSALDLNNMKSGAYWIYRPAAGILR